MRLTVHIKNAPFVQKEQKNVGTKEAPKYKPKKKKCIVNTITQKGLLTQRDVDMALSYIRTKHTIGVWEKGEREGQEMIHITHE